MMRFLQFISILSAFLFCIFGPFYVGIDILGLTNNSPEWWAFPTLILLGMWGIGGGIMFGYGLVYVVGEALQ